MSDLDEKEQNHVRTAIRILRRKIGSVQSVADALHFGTDYIRKVLNHGCDASPTLAFRVARLADMPIDDLLSGKFAPAGTCPHCGHAPDFSDEETTVEDAPRTPRGRGLKAVR